MYQIQYSSAALADLQSFKKYERQQIFDGIATQLIYEPKIETRNRKPLKDSPKAEWELRIGDFRVLYNVEIEIQIVEIQRVGKKDRDRFLFRGKPEDV